MEGRAQDFNNAGHVARVGIAYREWYGTSKRLTMTLKQINKGQVIIIGGVWLLLVPWFADLHGRELQGTFYPSRGLYSGLAAGEREQP